MAGFCGARGRAWLGIGVIIVVTLLGGGGLASPVAAAEPASLVIWVSPTGSDANPGTTRSQPIRTLARAHVVACSGDPAICPPQGRPVHVRLEPGRYQQPDLKWWYYDPTYPTVFMPADYTPGDTWADVKVHGGRPILDGRWRTHVGFEFAPRRASPTGRTNLQFLYLEWSGYVREPLAFAATQAQRSAGNVVYGNWFHHVGNYWTPSSPLIGWAGIALVGSDRNAIVNNLFTNIENNPATAGVGHEHGVYLIDAKANVIRANRFEVVGGDPVRVRDGSNGNVVEGNTFRRTGNRGYVADWYCTPAATNCSPAEDRSSANVARANTYLGPYKAYATFRTVFCYDVAGGACPPERIRVVR